MEAIVMAGGLGTRLAPHTQSVPKPLMPVGGRPIAEIVLRQLRHSGVDRVTIALGHMGEQVRAALGDGGRFGLRVAYVQEDRPLGTCGALAEMVEDLDENFVLVNGDLLTDLDIRRMIEKHTTTGADVTVGTFELEERVPYGVLTVGDDGLITTYREKPLRAHDISMGAYVLRRDSLRPYLRSGERLDMPDLIAAMIADRRHIRAFKGASFWIDIGTPSDYVRAIEMLALNPRLHEFTR